MKPLILILAMAAAGPAWGQTAILPGYWETTNQVTSPFPTKKTERRCISFLHAFMGRGCAPRGAGMPLN